MPLPVNNKAVVTRFLGEYTAASTMDRVVIFVVCGDRPCPCL